MVEIDRIDLLIKEQGRSRSWICLKIGKANNYINGVIASEKPFREDILQQIADILGTTTDYLHGKTDIKNKPTEIGELTAEESKMLDIYRSFTEEQKKEFWIGLSEKK